MTTPLRLHPEAREERRRALRRMRDPSAAIRFRRAVDDVFDHIEESPAPPRLLDGPPLTVAHTADRRLYAISPMIDQVTAR